MASYGNASAAIRIYDGTDEVFIDALWWECDCIKGDEIHHIAGGYSYSTQIGERKQYIRAAGVLTYPDNIQPKNIKNVLDQWKRESVSPIQCSLVDEDDNYIQFMDEDGAPQNFLNGYVMTSPIKHVKDEYLIQLYFEDCEN